MSGTAAATLEVAWCMANEGSAMGPVTVSMAPVCAISGPVPGASSSPSMGVSSSDRYSSPKTMSESSSTCGAGGSDTNASASITFCSAVASSSVSSGDSCMGCAANRAVGDCPSVSSGGKMDEPMSLASGPAGKTD